MRRLTLIFAAIAAFTLLLAGCASETTDKTTNTDTKATNETQTTTTTTTQTTSETTKPATTETTASADSIGVPECDEYLKKYEACLNGKVPEAARAAYKTSFETTRKSWKEAAATASGKAGLAQGCKAALDAAKKSMTSFGCEW
jgi:outer membrane murein-binding lipoprotein Lpp